MEWKRIKPKQQERRFYMADLFWNTISRSKSHALFSVMPMWVGLVWNIIILQFSAHNTLKDLEGVHTVICLDISASMAEGNAWLEATTFLEDYLKGDIKYFLFILFNSYSVLM